MAFGVAGLQIRMPMVPFVSISYGHHNQSPRPRQRSAPPPPRDPRSPCQDLRDVVVSTVGEAEWSTWFCLGTCVMCTSITVGQVTTHISRNTAGLREDPVVPITGIPAELPL